MTVASMMDGMTRLLRLSALICLAVIAVRAAAQTQPQANDISVAWFAEEVPKPGETVMTALRFTPRSPEWHGYWSNPGDAGLGMQVDWRLPEGWSAGEPLYPVPQTLTVAGLMSHIYEGEYAVLVPLTVGRDGPVRASIAYLACTDTICVPQQAEVMLQIPSARHDGRFDQWRAATAPVLTSQGRLAINGDLLRLAIPLPATQTLGDPHVFIGNEQLVESGSPQQFFREGDLLVAEVPLAGTADDPSLVTGILSFDDGTRDGVRFSARWGDVPTGLAAMADNGLTPTQLLLLLGGALLGGLLLNVMPCVFPILSLKALALVRAGVSQREARRDGIAYAGGAVITCLMLGAIVLLLRAGGEQVGWAFQLQDPAIVVALFVLATVIAANFLGMFEIPSLPLRSGGKPGGAFATGALAAFVATPCTGPFMAAALGAALLLPVLPALAMFAALGFGLALPFLLLGFVPALRQRLPRPGGWMTTFRRWMALPMGLTAAALLWLLWRVGGGWFAAFSAALALAVIIGLAHLWGRQILTGFRPRRWGAGLAALVAVSFSILLTQVFNPSSDTATGTLQAAPFTEAKLADARSTGAPVFVYFSADWCLTCKVNEQVAIEREATRAAFEKASVVALRGDWTRRDPDITRFLTQQGAAGVPLYLWYAPGSGPPQTLPQILTANMLIERATASDARQAVRAN